MALSIPSSYPYYIVFVLQLIFIATVPINLLLRKWNIHLPDNLITFVLAVITGVTVASYTPFLEFAETFVCSPEKLLNIYIPTFITASMIRMEYYVFTCCLPQVLVISIAGALLCPLVIALLMTYIVYEEWTYLDGLLAAYMVTPIQPAYIVSLFKKVTKNRYLATFIEEEAIIVLVLSLSCFTVFINGEDYHDFTWYYLLYHFFFNIVGGMAIGITIGLVKIYFMRVINNDPLCAICITTGLTYFTFYVAQCALWLSGTAAVFCVSFLFIKERYQWTTQMDMFVRTFWKTLHYWMDIGILYICVTWLCIYLMSAFEMRSLYGSVSLYLIGGVLKALKNIILQPILNRMTYQMSITTLLVLSFTDTKGCINLILLLMMLVNTTSHNTTGVCVMHMLFYVLLTNAMNCVAMNRVLTWTGFLSLSQGRIKHINACIKTIHERRLLTMQSLKLNRYLSSGIWHKIINDTIMPNPFANKEESNITEDKGWEDEKMGCPLCDEEINVHVTEDDLSNLLMDARTRIYKAMKVSVINQFVKGLINKNCLQVLTHNLELSLESGKGYSLEFVNKFITENKLLVLLRRAVVYMYAPKYLNPPRTPCQRLFFFLVMHKAYEFVIFILTLANCIVCAWNHHKLDEITTMIYHETVWILYFIDMCLKFFAGPAIYFRLNWNIYDFVLLAFGAFNICLTNKSNVFDWLIYYVFVSYRTISVLRLVKVISLFGILYPAILRRIDVIINNQICFGYDLVKAAADCSEEISQNFAQILDMKIMRDFYRKEATEEKRALLKKLEIIQNERPWVATTVKTKQTIRQVLKTIRSMLNELKVTGYLDEIEYAFIMKDVFEKEKILRNMTYVEPTLPIIMFREVPWMHGDQELISFLHSRVQMVNWEPGQVVCTYGKRTKGIYIIINGILRLSFQARQQVAVGLLPVVDRIAQLHFNRDFDDNITSGGTVGELAVLTNRPYDCNIVSESKCVAYFLPTEVIWEAVAMRKDPIVGLEALMWKCCVINLAEAILAEVPVYQSFNQEQIKLILETSFMPDVTKFKLFVVTEMIYDIILMEGIAADEETGEQMIAPMYISRTTQKILMPPSGMIVCDPNIITRLLIIPSQDATAKEIMDQVADIGEVISSNILVQTSANMPSLVQCKVDVDEILTKPSTTALDYYWMPDKNIIRLDRYKSKEESVSSGLEAIAYLTKNKVLITSSSSSDSIDMETPNVFKFDNLPPKKATKPKSDVKNA